MNTSLIIGLVCFLANFSLGSTLQCYKCMDYSGRCSDVQDCSYQDACLSLNERGGKTIRKCIRYTDCDNARLTQMFPSVSGFTYRCCSSNLCNASPGTMISRSFLGLLAPLLVFWCSLI
ncbi:CD59 glycoprotein-like [Anguilla rostrata]|nr:CD59 glycoprotein [Anguilla anguilla]